MKAKIIKTGEIVDVYHEPQHGQVSNIYKESFIVYARTCTENELEFCEISRYEDDELIEDLCEEMEE